MPKYLVQVNYVGEGIKGLLKEGGSSRRDVAKKAVKSLGGKVEAFYFAFGDHDAYMIIDVPDHSAATKLALTVGASGAVAVKTVVLMTPEEVDAATKKPMSYRAPGK